MYQSLGDNWGAETSPSGNDLLYLQAADQIAPGIVDYALTIITSGETLLNAVNRARISVSMTDAQRELLAVQMERARLGLPPTVTRAPSGIDQKTLLLIAAGVLVVWLMTRRGA